jgi:hypothetical protein
MVGKGSSMLAVATTIVLSFASSASAQICLANPPLGANASANVSFGASFFNGGKSYDGGVLFGGDVFGGAGLAYMDYDNTSLSFKEVSGTVGVDVSKAEHVSVCPKMSAGYDFGLKILGVSVTQWVLAPGLSVGFRSDVSETVAVVPAAQASFIYARTSADAGIGGSASDSETYGLISAGLSFLFNNRLALTPAVAVPVGLTGGDASFGISATVAAGGR